MRSPARASSSSSRFTEAAYAITTTADVGCWRVFYPWRNRVTRSAIAQHGLGVAPSRRRHRCSTHYDETGLRFAGQVSAGFVPHLRREVFKALKPHHVDGCPFVDLPNPKASRWGGGVTADEMREMQ